MTIFSFCIWSQRKVAARGLQGKMVVRGVTKKGGCGFEERGEGGLVWGNDPQHNDLTDEATKSPNFTMLLKVLANWMISSRATRERPYNSSSFKDWTKQWLRFNIANFCTLGRRPVSCQYYITKTTSSS